MSTRLPSLHVMLEYEILKNRTSSWEEKMDVRWKGAGSNSQALAETKENGLELISLLKFCCFPLWWYRRHTGDTGAHHHHRAKHISGPREAEGGFSKGWRGWLQTQIMCHTSKLRWKAAVGMICRATWWLHLALPSKMLRLCPRVSRNCLWPTLTRLIQERGFWKILFILAQLIF